MGDVLLRGFPEKIHRWIRKAADLENLSANQFFLRIIKKSLQEEGMEEETVERQKQAIRRIDERREKLFQKYGLFEDSTAWIREDRDSH